VEIVAKSCLEGNAVTRDGVTVTLDVMYDLVVDGELYGRMYGSPQGFEDVVLGVLVERGSPRAIKKLTVVRIEPGLLRVEATTGEALVLKPVHDMVLDWELVVKAIGKGLSVASKRECPLAAHVGAALTVVGGRVELLGYGIDVSRHTLAFKLAGILARARAEHSLPTAIAVLTARLSGDIVSTLARAGYRVVAAPHHPLSSGVAAAVKHGVTLVGKAGVKPNLVPVVGSQRLKGVKERLDQARKGGWYPVTSTAC
jgi:formate dehydrogenase assembly factor FdhD